MLTKQSIKYIQSLQHKKFRDEYGVFVAEGPKMVEELLASAKFECDSIFSLAKWVESVDSSLLESVAGKIQLIEAFELEKIAHYSTPNAVVAVFRKRTPIELIDTKGNITLVLDGIQDPGNLGTIIRNADWFGIKNIVCSATTVDMYNSKVVQSTMASLARVDIFYTDLNSWLGSHHDVKILATVLDGSPIHLTQRPKEAIVIIGNESNGINTELLQFADEKITISRFGMAESLNAGVASGIVLYELLRE